MSYTKLIVISILACVVLSGITVFRRPYAIESIALELECPGRENDIQCVLYSRFGVIYEVPKLLTSVTCNDPSAHFVGRNSDGAGQCCPAGQHWDGPNSERCSRDAH